MAGFTERRRLGIGIVSVVAVVAGLFAVPIASSASSVPVIVIGDASGHGVELAVESAGGEITRDLGIVDGVAATVPADRVADLRASAGVGEVVPDESIQLAAQYGSGSGVASAVYTDVVRADKAWKSGYTGAGVGIAVIDTGINGSGDLAGKVLHSIDFSGEGDGVDRFGHGTFIGGLIAGSGAASAGAVMGVAPGAHLVSIKIAGRDGSADISHVLAALQWAVSFKDAYGIRVINLSLGTDSRQDYRIDPLNRAVEKAWQSGLVVVVSAGNTGPDARTISKPADDPWVVTVGAVDDRTTAVKTDDGVPAFTAVGPTAANGIAKPDLAAPGKSVVSLRAPGSYVDQNNPSARVGTSYFKGSGTSFSTAITSAAAALVLSGTPTLTPDQVKYRLVSTTTAGPVTDPNLVGAGWLDAYAAALSTSTTAANVGLETSDGSGSLQASRGSLSVEIQTGLLSLLGMLFPIFEQVTGPLTAQDTLFDAAEYFTGEWYASRWYASRWYASRWYASRWYASRWYASRWYGADWE